jgi:hypothetical protein
MIKKLSEVRWVLAGGRNAVCDGYRVSDDENGGDFGRFGGFLVKFPCCQHVSGGGSIDSECMWLVDDDGTGR